MRSQKRFYVPISLLSASLLLGGSAYAQTSPFSGKKKVTITPATAPAMEERTSVSVDFTAVKRDVDLGNTYAGSDYKNFFLAQSVIQGTITFSDETKNYERFAWFQQVLSEHGCQTLSLNKSETKTGGLFNKKKILSVSAKIKGRAFVVKAIKGHYGGSVSDSTAVPTSMTDSQLLGILEKEKDSQAAEEQILQYAFEIDDLIAARSKLGLLDLKEKSRIDKRMEELKGSLIPAAKNQVNGNTAAIRNSLLELADRATQKGEFKRTIALMDAYGLRDDKSIWRYGNAYQGLKEYDKAIAQYKGLTGSATMSEKAWNGIAECQHQQGKDADSLASLLKVLEGFHNTREELDALAKIDQWKLMRLASSDPSLPDKVSDIYISKAMLNNGNAHPQAVKDYGKAVDVRANGGSKAEASRNILAAASNVQAANSQALDRSRQAADQRFMLERERARGSVEAWQASYDRAVSNARSDYQSDLSAKRKALDEARRDLDYQLRNPPAGSSSGSSGSTDPYGDSSGSSGTDPYSGTSSKKSGSSTDPYSDGSSGSNTDPYSGGSSNSNTDPYSSSGSSSDYQGRLDTLRSKVDRLDSEYRWLTSHKTDYIDEHTSSERRSLRDAEAAYAKYDLSRKPAYIGNDAAVQKYTKLTNESGAYLRTLSGLAKEAGY